LAFAAGSDAAGAVAGSALLAEDLLAALAPLLREAAKEPALRAAAALGLDPVEGPRRASLLAAAAAAGWALGPLDGFADLAESIWQGLARFAHGEHHQLDAMQLEQIGSTQQ
jgi:hypothetical protein